MKRTLLNICLAAFAALVLLGSCKKEEEEETLLNIMVGEVTFDIPNYLLKNDYYTTSATGIIEPEGVLYKWVVNNSSDTLVGQTVTLRIDEAIGTFNVSVSAHANKYYTSSSTKTIHVIDTSNNVSFRGITHSDKDFIDPRDEMKYNYITIGSLDWFSQNLAYSGAGVPYMNSPITAGMFGYFYSWDEVTGGQSYSGLAGGPQGPCPEGWVVPTNEDWEDLATAINGGKALSFSDKWEGVGEKVSADAFFEDTRMWDFSPDNMHTNDFGWNAIPVGHYSVTDKKFSAFGYYGFWWSATEKNDTQAYYRYIYTDYAIFPMNYTSKKDFGASVRCVRLAE